MNKFLETYKLSIQIQEEIKNVKGLKISNEIE